MKERVPATSSFKVTIADVARESGVSLVTLSLVGLDNIKLTPLVSPLLTTKRVDKMGMGRLAAQLLVNRIHHSEVGYVKTVIQPSLIRRESVAAIKDE